MATTRGRPSIGKSALLNARIRPELREQLEDAAKQSGRSLSHEIEARLTQSFAMNGKVRDQFGSESLYWLMRAIALVIADFVPGEQEPEEWLDNEFNFDLACRAIVRTAEALAPDGLPPWTDLQRDVFTMAIDLALFRTFAKIAESDGNASLNSDTILFSRLKRELGRRAKVAASRSTEFRIPPADWVRRMDSHLVQVEVEQAKRADVYGAGGAEDLAHSQEKTKGK